MKEWQEEESAFTYPDIFARLLNEYPFGLFRRLYL